MKVTLLHYRFPPAVAGVEWVLAQHLEILRREGVEVTGLAGCGGSGAVVLKELAESGDVGESEEAFEEKVRGVMTALRPYFEDADRVVVHNMLSMPFHMATTVAIQRLADELPAGRIINWVHDLAALDPHYSLPRSADGVLLPPWDCLARDHPKMVPVAISDWRAEQYLSLTGCPAAAVVPNGVDPLGLLPLTPPVEMLARRLRLLEADIVLFQPARVLARKRIELGFDLLQELRRRGFNAQLLITAAEDGHHAASRAYHQEMLRRREELELPVTFVSEHFPVAHADLLALYSLADVLWFPSQQEGFGLPILEGALHRLPVFCADLPPMNRFALSSMAHFDPVASSAQIADRLLAFLQENGPFPTARKQVIKRFSWETIGPALLTLLHTPPIRPLPPRCSSS